MTRLLLFTFVFIWMAGCGKEDETKMGFSIIGYGMEDVENTWESSIQTCITNIEENVRLIYLMEELDEDLKKERAIEVKYNVPQVIKIKNGNKIMVERAIIFFDGRLKVDPSASYVPIVIVASGVITVWHSSTKGCKFPNLD